MPRPLVSILIITYNQEHLIRETLESCLKQNFDSLEIVVSDDGSSDQTPLILEGIQREHPEVVRLVLNPTNQGVTANCNAGLAMCSGTYIALMGGDDVLFPEKIRRQVEAFDANPQLVLSYHPCQVMEDGLVTGIVGDRAKDIVRNQIDMIAKFGAALPGPATMVRADSIPIGGFNTVIGTASDWMYFIDVSAKGEVGRINEPLAIYRQHAGNIGKRFDTYSDDFLKTLELTKLRYGDLPGVRVAIRRGGMRFLLGAVYRSMENGKFDLARDYAEKLRLFAPIPIVVALTSVIRIPGAQVVFRQLKKLLKRYV